MRGSTQRLEASGGRVSISASTHPNEMRFRGVLVRLDEPSTKPPNGSDGHKIFLSTAVAKEKLSTLIGMGLNYAPSLDTHAQRRKVGVIQKAWIKGRDLCVSGVIWKHDFPEAVKDLKRDGLGMSMELGKVSVEDVKADIWHLEDFYFLGATILKKDAAAYYKTLAIAAKADEGSKGMAQKVVKKVEKKVEEMSPAKIAAIAARAATAAVTKAFQPQFEALNSSMEQLSQRVEEIDIAASMTGSEAEEEIEIAAGEEEEIEACAKCGKEHGEQEACGDMKSSKHKDEEDSDDEDDDDMDSEADEMESEGIDKGSLEEMGPDDEEVEGTEPGHLNQGAKNRGHDGAGADAKKVGPTKSMGVTGAAVAVLRKAVKELSAQVKSLQAAAKENRVLKARLAKYEKQVKAASMDINRRSMAPELTGLLAKASLDADDLRTSGQKLSAVDVDAIFANAGVEIPTVKRIELKNQLMRAGLMDEGHVQRNGAGR